MKKKKLLILFLFLLFPFQVLAYSDYIIPGGENVGIEIHSKGIMVIGFYKVNGELNTGNLKVGDLVTKINNIEVNRIDELINAINDTINDGKIEITYTRNKKEGNTTTLSLALVEGIYKTGLYVKDSLTGIGTLTYIDPSTLIYGALGHEIIESTTKNKIEVKTGIIFKSSIQSILKSVDGNPGGKNAKFYYNTEYGTIEKNTNYGIYGIYKSGMPDKELLAVGNKNDVKLGKAHIYTVLDGEKIDIFEITITKIVKDSFVKNIHFTVTDERLLNRTGGIVQGMSGSPIIQNDKIIGAVTHVVVDNVETGYGIFITTMLEEGER